MKILLIMIASVVLLASCANQQYYNPLEEYEEVDAVTNLDMPTPANVSADVKTKVAHGEYLVEMLGCGSCHTDGALVGKPDMRRSMAGSSVGIAYTNPLENKNPGIVFPRNLTPDRKTGLGTWTTGEIAAAVRSGAGRHGQRRILVMPWQRYAKISDTDVQAIIDYLRSLDPVVHQVPNPVPAGTRTRNPYVHFGVYRSRAL